VGRSKKKEREGDAEKKKADADVSSASPHSSSPVLGTEKKREPKEKESSVSPPRGRANAWGVSVLVPAPRDGNQTSSPTFSGYGDDGERGEHDFVGLGRYDLSDDLCCAVWEVAKNNLDALQPVFYAHDEAQKGYLTRTELRAALRHLEPRCSARQVDRVEAMLLAATSDSGDDALRHTTLDALVRAAHGGASAAARLETPEGCLSAAALVAALENALADDATRARLCFRRRTRPPRKRSRRCL
jgi:hypothetical protein